MIRNVTHFEYEIRIFVLDYSSSLLCELVILKRTFYCTYKNELLLNDSLYIHRHYRSISSDENKILLYKYASSQLRANSHRNQILKLSVLKQIWNGIFEECFNSSRKIKYICLKFSFKEGRDV